MLMQMKDTQMTRVKRAQELHKLKTYLKRTEVSMLMKFPKHTKLLKMLVKIS